jgi:hypothetical protein
MFAGFGSDGLDASAIVHVDGGNGGVMAVSNNVNYDVQCDGSASFNLVKTEWSPPVAIALGDEQGCGAGRDAARLSLNRRPEATTEPPGSSYYWATRSFAWS